MSVQKCISTKNFNVDGCAFGYKPNMPSGVTVDRATKSFTSSGYYTNKDNSPQSWTTLSSIDSTGSVVFSNIGNGGSLASVIVANRGSQNLYVGFNNGTPTTSSGFLVATGEAISYNETVITKIWAITSTGISTIGAQGLYQTNKYFEV